MELERALAPRPSPLPLLRSQRAGLDAATPELQKTRTIANQANRHQVDSRLSVSARPCFWVFQQAYLVFMVRTIKTS